jgi:hypothetical protein
MLDVTNLGADSAMDDLNKPILPGTAASDYERYLRTDELLALQKSPSERVNDDELMFGEPSVGGTVVKLAAADVERATALIDQDALAGAIRLPPRGGQLDWSRATHACSSTCRPDYRRSAADSDKRGRIHPASGRHHLSPLLGEAFTRVLHRRGLD